MEIVSKVLFLIRNIMFKQPIVFLFDTFYSIGIISFDIFLVSIFFYSIVLGTAYEKLPSV